MRLNNLNFHQTFPPEEAMLSRLLTSDVFGIPMTKEDISRETGIPTGKSSGKVEPHIAYASYMGLIDDSYKEGKHYLRLTPLGSQIVKEDPGIHEEVTRMLCHLRISSPFSGAPLWAAIVSELLPHRINGLSPTALLDSLSKEATSNINLGPFYSSYEDTLFAPLKLIERSSAFIKLNKHTFSPELIYAYAYALFREWELKYPGRDEVTATEIESFYMYGAIGWSQADLYSTMEKFQDKRLLSFNRQLTPYTVTKSCSSEQMIPLLFSELL